MYGFTRPLIIFHADSLSANSYLDFGSKTAILSTEFEGGKPMATGRQADALLNKKSQQKLSDIGATEDQVDMKDTVPQRIDKKGTKVEDLAGTGEHDGSGG
jgi:hypothetical protein